MRVSVNKDSPLYDPTIDTAALHVFCDGRFLSLCVAFDSDEGWADVVALDHEGKVIIESNGATGARRAKLERLHGKITYRNHSEDACQHRAS